MPKVSVILPVYNGARFIARALQSVKQQSFSDWELIVVDDSSTDATPEVIRLFVGQDRRIRCLRNPENIGIQKSLNRGLSEAQGKYIARIDDDDEWSDKDKLKKQVEFLDTHPDYVLVGTGTIVVDESGKELFRFLNPVTDRDIRRQLLSRNCFTHSSVLFRKETAMRFGGYSEDKAVLHIEDYDLWLKMGTVGKLANLPLYGVKFTLRPGTISSKNKIDQFRKDIKLIFKFKDSYPGRWRAIIIGYLRLVVYGFLNISPLAIFKHKILKLYKNSL